MRAKERFGRAAAAIGLAIAVGACAAQEGGAPREIAVSAAQEQAMCEILAADFGTGPVPVNAAAQIADAPGINAAPGKKPVELTDLGDGWGGYLRLSLDPADGAPVLLLLDEPLQFAVVLADGSPVDLVDASSTSAQCPEAAGRYAWFVEDGENYLSFAQSQDPTINLVLEVVD